MSFYIINEIAKRENIPLRTLQKRAEVLGFEKKANTYFLSEEQVEKLLDPSLHKRGKRAKKKEPPLS